MKRRSERNITEFVDLETLSECQVDTIPTHTMQVGWWVGTGGNRSPSVGQLYEVVAMKHEA
jgi:hypothetical protein